MEAPLASRDAGDRPPQTATPILQQLSLLEEADGWRYQAFATNTRVGQLALLEARHRAHARVEDRAKAANDLSLSDRPIHAVPLPHVRAHGVEYTYTQREVGMHGLSVTLFAHPGLICPTRRPLGDGAGPRICWSGRWPILDAGVATCRR